MNYSIQLRDIILNQFAQFFAIVVVGAIACHYLQKIRDLLVEIRNILKSETL